MVGIAKEDNSESATDFNQSMRTPAARTISMGRSILPLSAVNFHSEEDEVIYEIPSAVPTNKRPKAPLLTQR